MSYYDIDDILSDSQKLPCTFNITVPGIGYLNGQPGKKIKKGTKVELPLWLAEILAIVEIGDREVDHEDNNNDEELDPETRFVEFVTPEFFSTKILNAIKADPTAMDLHAILMDYYKMVTKWGEMFKDEELGKLAANLLVTRACQINDLSLSLSSNSASVSAGKDDVKLLQNDQFLRSLDDFEKRLFKTCYQSYKDLKLFLKSQE